MEGAEEEAFLIEGKQIHGDGTGIIFPGHQQSAFNLERN